MALRNALNFATIACPLCIAKHLECISAPQSAKRLETLYARHRRTFEVVMCIFMPFLYEFLCVSSSSLYGVDSDIAF